MEQVPVQGKYQPYPEYKDSGIEWLGNIPSNWSVYSLKRSVTGCTNGIWGDEPNGENDLIVLRVADFDRDKLLISDAKLTYRSISEKESRSRLLTKGDLLIEKSGGGEKTLVGCVVLFDKDYAAVTSNFVAKMSPHDGYHSGFLNYAFSHLYNGRINYPSIKQTTGIQNLDSESYLMEHFCFPTYTEQRTIASFLDYETARIDKLIAQQQRLIELLKEKRQAVISHAVTKGLNPDAPMKDSGLEWLGTVPEHWVVLSLRYVIRTLEQGKSPECEARLAENDEWAVLKTGCVNGGIYSEKEHKALPSHISPHVSFEVKRGDLLMSRASGSRNLIGAVAYVHETRQKLLLSDKIFRLILEPNIDPQYLSLLMSSRPLRVQVEQAINGAEGLANNITKESIKSFAIVLPDVQEQLKIRSYLNQKLRKFENLEDKLKGGLVLLNERRSSLISSAVTGKIDLRGWEKPDA
ncbi:restriction endonuclease subunit S [Klebsiella michiganensis]|uniref:restriction endonuclease subunit S n=1 Tax=Klebsiella michiganensis TaxID=1134687 RepID=UPI0013740883|nr:restriction endonuclease subunit S [Klebsiella michiganensis]QHO89925.1 restriction endonuclease subunit S [Klebsiella michiganensis]